ncbi:PrgI family protein, partial [Mediterraneibacter gnavus]|uniref:PrgI family protein n=1 Tax=Mediterraneibacter gnavus TaxID=33038 RepID=UPI00321B3556
MEVKMNKEIRNYQESMFMGLNLRQCIFSLLAIAVAVGIYFGLGKYVGQEMTGWLCILGAAPFAACGSLLWSSIFVTLMANKIGGLQFGIYRN